jgi:5-methylcytosine-specific restriction endonuclease McrA
VETTRIHRVARQNPPGARVLYRDRWTCRQCGAPASHVDHVMPVLLGGTHDERNLQALCAGCNLAKGAR